jgi:hypothetical protein
MTRSTEELIAALAADIRPVRRLRPPMIRAAFWLAVIALLALAPVLLFSDLHRFAARMSQVRVAVEVAATLLTGVAGVVAAFHLALPDRSRAWALFPLPPALAWLAASGLGCWRAWVILGPAGLSAGATARCFLFIVAVSLPIGGLLTSALAKAKPLEPGVTAAVAGLGAAALSAFLLQFFHPFEVTLVDLGVHFAGVCSVVALCTGAGRRLMA